MDDGNNNNIDRKYKNRKRKIIWFNLPFCKRFTINIGRYFLNIVNKHFYKENPLSRIFNKNPVKISYPCTNNISKIIYNHNRKIIDKLFMDDKAHILPRNYGNKEKCSMGGWCNSENEVYQTNIFLIESKLEEKIYIDIFAGNWKQRLYNQRDSFTNSFLRNQTALSKDYWSLKECGLTPQIK